MASYWMTDCIPLSVTALLPIVAFPLLGLASTTVVCKIYIRKATLTLMGALMFAIAVEHCNLHKRVALHVLLLVGTSVRW